MSPRTWHPLREIAGEGLWLHDFAWIIFVDKGGDAVNVSQDERFANIVACCQYGGLHEFLVGYFGARDLDARQTDGVRGAIHRCCQGRRRAVRGTRDCARKDDHRRTADAIFKPCASARNEISPSIGLSQIRRAAFFCRRIISSRNSSKSPRSQPSLMIKTTAPLRKTGAPTCS